MIYFTGHMLQTYGTNYTIDLAGIMVVLMIVKDIFLHLGGRKKR